MFYFLEQKYAENDCGILYHVNHNNSLWPSLVLKLLCEKQANIAEVFDPTKRHEKLDCING